MRGGAGDDLISGGRGSDLLFGGAGSDVFQFRSADASERGALADRIKDFQQGEDRIDLSSVADEIDFIGSGAFSGAGNAELRFVAAGNGTARVLVDVDGDGTIDMRINLSNTPDLLETDFIL
ncbi:M10 family metallopeptidase C-terminal domain-containing protein [Sedimentitalea sp. XS_ASV28]|uniref:M10 family metallopeptidase C-terminal domain-containing protein n=1 Tax=Sedimentitalea sp. XS_ASV28 TaxID=3241296 RepID=UPI0035133AF6